MATFSLDSDYFYISKPMIDITEFDSKGWRESELENSSLYQAYLRKGKRIFFRNDFSRISIEVTDVKVLEVIKTGYKNGNKLIIDYETTTRTN